METTLIELEEPPDRWVDARCNDSTGNLTQLFFSDDLFDIRRAQAICRLCPLQAECLETALERAEPWGVWGGELLRDGKIYTEAKRNRGRPPKNPRPEVIITELGEEILVALSA